MNPYTQNPGQDRKTSRAKYVHATQPNKINDLHKPHKSHKSHCAAAIVPEPCDVLQTSQPFGKPWRDQVVSLTPEHLRALQEGQYVAVDVQNEYPVFLQFEQHKEPGHGE